MLDGRRNLRLVDTDRDAMRIAGKFNAQLMDFIRPHVQAGITTGEIDRLIHEYTLDHGHVPACLGYHGFPKSSCTSVNEVICHGIPGSYELKDGDIVNVDITSIVDGWHGDQSETILIGEVSDEARSVTQCAFDAMHAAIAAITPECCVAIIGRAVVAEAKKHGYGVVEEYVGHALGRRFHQEPSIPHVPTRATHNVFLMPGVCFTIEPMINLGTHETVLDRRDGWTVRTKDNKLSAQFEHTILMTETGPEILTLTQNGPQIGHQF
ncbi:type I methionyl aminopeptidase [Blastopirellula marina]|uniref:Methionine aminopeptidase n=1 Tax=Blastopirellula marina DSM 3645 TaxID=314230 RepID=A4A044_9BACT|nr:type I methionyl aminopeptidase [Blastopirellula marina]EAQ77830.1 Methionine aminopeptidase [Blastopirellula marina DSM 3645]